MTVDVAEFAVVQDGQSDKGQSHPKQIKKQRRCVLERILYEYEGRSPDDDDREEQEVGQGGRAYAAGQLVVRSSLVVVCSSLGLW